MSAFVGFMITMIPLLATICALVFNLSIYWNHVSISLIIDLFFLLFLKLVEIVDIKNYNNFVLYSSK